MQREIDRDRVTNSMLLWALDCSFKSSKFSVTWFFVEWILWGGGGLIELIVAPRERSCVVVVAHIQYSSYAILCANT